MRKSTTLLTGLIVTLTAFVASAAAIAGPNGSDKGTMCVYTTQLRAENEVPTSNSLAHGHSQIKVRNDGTIEFKTHIVNPEGERFTAGHIHLAPSGTPGGVVQSLFQGGATTEKQIMQSGEVTPTTPGLGAAICQNPSAYYVNYHSNPRHPAGAVRGQLG